jgi:hypothetical protein
MRKALAVVVLGLMAVFSVPFAPAFAGDLSVGPEAAGFQALSGLPDARRAELTGMTDEQLSAVEGMFLDTCVVCIQAARVRQVNVNESVFGSSTQINSAVVVQKQRI